MEDSKRFSTSSHSLCSGSISSYLSELARCLSNVSRAIVIRNKALLPRDSFRSHPLSDENSSEILTEALYERRRKREKKREGGQYRALFLLQSGIEDSCEHRGWVFIVFFERTILLVSILLETFCYYQSGPTYAENEIISFNLSKDKQSISKNERCLRTILERTFFLSIFFSIIPSVYFLHTLHLLTRNYILFRRIIFFIRVVIFIFLKKIIIARMIEDLTGEKQARCVAMTMR